VPDGAARSRDRPSASGGGRGYAFVPREDERPAEERPFARKAGRSPRRSWSPPDRALALFMIAAAAVAFAALLVALVPSALRITRFEIAGASSMTEEDVLAAALVRPGESFLSVKPDRVRASLEADPRVSSAAVAKVLPNRLRMSIVERKAVATAVVEIGGRPAAVKIDAEGVAFAAATADEAAALPVLSGLRFEDFRLGARLPPSLSPVLSSLGKIRDEEPLLLSAFSEIRVVKRAKGDPELVLYPIAARIPVRSGAALSAQSLRSMILVLDVLGTKGIAGTVEELDFRSGTVVYRGKEDHSG
jgi:cell division septal protein FtsQ